MISFAPLYTIEDLKWDILILHRYKSHTNTNFGRNHFSHTFKEGSLNLMLQPSDKSSCR